MRRSNEEKKLLTKLESGILDGMVGDEKVYHGYKDVYCGKYIKNGEPVSYREGESTRFLMAKKMKEYQERELKNVMIQMIENLNFFRDMVG